MKLILLNGPSGVGKTTVAKKLHEIMPLSFLLDLDEQRQFISQYRIYPEESGSLSFDIALAIAEACLRNGRDFICGKGMLDLVESGREKNVLDLFLDLGKKYDAEIYEIFLWADKQTVIDRANERGYEVKVTHTPEKVANTWDQMNLFKMKRTKAIVVDTNNLSQAEVFKKLKDVIGITDNNEIVS